MSVYLSEPGETKPLGVTFKHNLKSANFAIYAPDASHIWIHFFLPDTEELVARVELKNRTGKVFHGEFRGIEPHYLYAVQAIQKDPEKGKEINDKILIDPYAKALNKSLTWSQVQYDDNNPFMLPKALIKLPSFDWQGVKKPDIAQHDTILYELHVKGFSQQNTSMPAEHRGKYLGLVATSNINYLKDLGVTSVQLMPVFSYMSEPRLQELGLTNFWGYNPINFFAPDNRYAISDPVNEFKTMVREFHRNNIEVIIDVVFNHTAEGGRDGPVLSFKGLVEKEFYLRSEDDYNFAYANYTGCGNTINADSDFGIQIIMDALRYWLEEMQVDGFRFDLAASLGRNGDRFNRRAALFRAMAQDPVISQAKLIAEPWDIGPEGYQLGNFPASWLECNDRYRDTVRKFWRADLGLVPELASRILGSRDIFKKGKRNQASSVNYVTYHDGFTLHDLVSYGRRHNEANLEDNKDGHGSNYSFNYGVEGETADPAIMQRRQLQKRNMLATLLLSQGIPHLLAGDELNRTQLGNNNAYCQDNETSWVNWQLDANSKELNAFVAYLISLRRHYPLLKKCFLADDSYEAQAYHHHVNWVKPNGENKQLDDWQNNENQCLGLVIADDDERYQLLLIINASSTPVDYTLPNSSPKQRLLDTVYGELLTSVEIFDDVYSQAPSSLSLWKIPF